MKKFIYTSLFLVFSISIANAGSVETKKNSNYIEVTKVELIDKRNGVFITKYRGKCLDGHTFYFYEENREEAQSFVNGYCKIRRDYQIRDILNYFHL